MFNEVTFAHLKIRHIKNKKLRSEDGKGRFKTSIEIKGERYEVKEEKCLSKRFYVLLLFNIL